MSSCADGPCNGKATGDSCTLGVYDAICDFSGQCQNKYEYNGDNECAGLKAGAACAEGNGSCKAVAAGCAYLTCMDSSTHTPMNNAKCKLDDDDGCDGKVVGAECSGGDYCGQVAEGCDALVCLGFGS
jgi:hypothetical protein